MTAPWQSWLDETRSAGRDELFEVLRIPSVSTDPAFAKDVRRCAEWVAARMTRAGVPTVKMLDTALHPVVYGAWHAAPGKPTVLIYGHYDVQPVDPLNLWASDPFEPTLRDSRIYARGSSDMKANLVTVIQAIEALAKTHGAPPVNLTFFFEGEEEIASPHAADVLAEYEDMFGADLVLSCDGGQAGPDLGRLTVAFKGVTGLQINLTTGSTDLHAGSYGAAVPNAAQAIAKLAASFHDENGRVMVDGFYDDVIDLTDQDRAEFKAAAIPDDELMTEAGVRATWGEPGYSAPERRGGRPTIDVNGIWGGFQGAGVKTVTPCEAHLKVTARLVANQDNRRIADLIKKHALKHAPAGAEISFSDIESGSRPYMAPRSFLGEQIAVKVLTDHYGAPPQIARAGGSVPILSTFRDILGIDTVTIGFGLPGSQAHAPNEWYLESQFDRARTVYASFLDAF
jgi:acetylornithine deacetylase/succinyl-diaminopimelate desuccinylase-like protein